MSADSEGNQPQRPALTRLMKIGWAAGDVGIACYVGGTMTYLLFYLTQAHGLAPGWAGIALLIPRMLDVPADPIMGAISDRTVTAMGRRRPYLLGGALAFGLTFYLTFAIPEFHNPMVTVLYATVAYFLASLAYTVFAIPHAAMAAEMTPSYRERTSVVGYRMVGSRLGILMVGLAGPYLFSAGETLRDGFRIFGAVFALVVMIGGVVSFRATRDAPRIERPAVRFNLGDEARALARNAPFRTLFTVFLLQNIAIGMSATGLVYFATFIVGIEVRHVGWLASGGAIVAMLATPLWMRAGHRWGVSKRRVYTIAILIEVCAYTGLLFFAQPGRLWLVFGLVALLGIGDAACQLAPHSMVPDTVEADEVATGVRRDGTIFGALSACLKLGMAIGAFFASLVLQVTGFVSGQSVTAQGSTALLGVRLAYCAVPILLWMTAVWLVRRYDLDERRHGDLRDELQRRDTAANPLS